MKTFAVGQRGEVPLRMVKATSRLDALRQIKFQFNGTVQYSGNRNPVLHGSTLAPTLIATEMTMVDGEWVERDEVTRHNYWWDR